MGDITRRGMDVTALRRGAFLATLTAEALRAGMLDAREGEALGAALSDALADEVRRRVGADSDSVCADTARALLDGICAAVSEALLRRAEDAVAAREVEAAPPTSGTIIFTSYAATSAQDALASDAPLIGANAAIKVLKRVADPGDPLTLARLVSEGSRLLRVLIADAAYLLFRARSTRLNVSQGRSARDYNRTLDVLLPAELEKLRRDPLCRTVPLSAMYATAAAPSGTGQHRRVVSYLTALTAENEYCRAYEDCHGEGTLCRAFDEASVRAGDGAHVNAYRLCRAMEAYRTDE